MNRNTASRRKCLSRSVLSTAMAAVLAFSLGAGGAHADELDDRKAALESEIAKVQQSIEFLDADIARTIAELKMFQGQLPAAQQALADAEGRVVTATNEVNALAARVELAQETKDNITRQLDQDQAQMADTKKVIGQIATQAYKNGGVPSNLSLFFGNRGSDSLTDSMGLAGQALRSQTATMDSLAQQSATNANSEARLAAVEEEIRGLKAQADAALATEQEARDAAAAEKAKVDQLIADTSRLSDELQAKRPEIEAQLAATEAAHQQVQNEIAERQRREREAWLAAQAAAAEAARAAAEAEGRPAPAPPVTTGSPSAFGLRHPVPASIPITSGYGWRPTPVGTVDFNGTGGYTHTGIDFGTPCGTPLYAPAAGEIWYADSYVLPGAGNRIVINHGVVEGNSLATNYYHLTNYVVSAGDKVSAGQLIGYTGTTGNSTGCHLHFETSLNGTLVDPRGLL